MRKEKGDEMSALVVASLFKVDWPHYASALLSGVAHTLAFTVVGFTGAAILGLGIALLRVSHARLLRAVAATYTELFKNIPLLAIVFLVYFGLPTAGVLLSSFVAGAVSLIFFYAAYLAEIFRSAISGVSADQSEAAQALGMSKIGTFTRVVFPQAVRTALPGTNTMLVDCLKSTSLLVLISAAELMSEGQQITSVTFRALEVYLVISAIYFCMCYPLSQALLMLERKVRAGVPLLPGRRHRIAAAKALLAQTAAVSS
jgi:His/Glu/Gln/Arg/opine family amino acid ABC transporter permease subunit